MKRLLIAALATLALAVPTSASAHFGHHHGLFEKLSGTGTSFGAASATASGTIDGRLLDGGTFSASVSTTWSSATTKTGEHGTFSCAPATATLHLVGTTTSNAANASLTGKTCAFTKTDGTVVRAFFGKGALTGTGTLASLNTTGRALLFQKPDGTVKGFLGARRHEEDHD